VHDASGSGEGGQRLRSSVELLQLAEEAGRLGLFEWHVQVGTLRVSPGFLSLHGLTEFDGRYESWLKCIFREDLPRLNDLMESAFAAHAREMQTDFRIVPPDGDAVMWMEARSLIFYDAKGEAVRVVGVNVDVTDRKRAAAQLRAFTETLEDRVRERTRELEAENEARTKAEELLRQSQKMEVVGQLTGGVAHDFNNLLTIIQGGLDMIGRQMPVLDPSPAAARIVRAKDMALEGVRRAARLTDRLLAFARQQPLDPTTTVASEDLSLVLSAHSFFNNAHRTSFNATLAEIVRCVHIDVKINPAQGGVYKEVIGSPWLTVVSAARCTCVFRNPGCPCAIVL
jgi:PAS domain S-box-containing protein